MPIRTLKNGRRVFVSRLLKANRNSPRPPKAVSKRAAALMARGSYAKRVRSKPVRSKRYTKNLMGRTIVQEGKTRVTRRLISTYLNPRKRKGLSTGHASRMARKKARSLRTSSQAAYRGMTNTVRRAVGMRSSLRPRYVGRGANRSRTAMGLTVRRALKNRAHLRPRRR